MEDLTEVTRNLQRTNRSEIVSSLNKAENQLQGSAARAAFVEITKTLSEQKEFSRKDFIATQSKINSIARDFEKIGNAADSDKQMISDILKASQDNLRENASLKKGIGEFVQTGVSKSIDGLGGILQGALSQSPILAMGAGFIGDRIQNFREKRRKDREEAQDRQDQIAREVQVEQEKMKILREQITTEELIKKTALTEEQVANMKPEQLQAEKDILIQTSLLRKREQELLEERIKKEEDLRREFGIDRAQENIERPEPSQIQENENIVNLRPETIDVENNQEDVVRVVEGNKEKLVDIDEKLGPNTPYLEEIRDVLSFIRTELQTPDVTLEEKREINRLNLRNQRIQEDQLKALMALKGGIGVSGRDGNEGSVLDRAGDVGGVIAGVGGLAGALALLKKGGLRGLITGIPALLGLSAAMDAIPDKKPTTKKPTAKPTTPRKAGRLGRLFDTLKQSRAAKIVGGTVTAITGGSIVKNMITSDAEKVPDVTPDKTPKVDAPVAKATPTPSARRTGGGLEEARKIVASKTKPVVSAASEVVKSGTGKVSATVASIDKTAMKKILTSKAAKAAAKAIPAIGALAGGVFALGRLFEGDFVGAAAETGGIFLPSLAGAPLDIGLMSRDAYNDYFGTDKEPRPHDKDAISNPELFKARMNEITKMAKEIVGLGSNNVEKFNAETAANTKEGLNSEIAIMQKELAEMSGKSGRNFTRSDRSRVQELKKGISNRQEKIAGLDAITPQTSNLSIPNPETTLMTPAGTSASVKVEAGNMIDNQAMKKNVGSGENPVVAANIAPVNNINSVTNNNTLNRVRPQVKNQDPSFGFAKEGLTGSF